MPLPRRIVTKLLGELLIERGTITRPQLEEALARQHSRGGLLGQILVELGYAREDDIAQMLTTQYGLPFLPLREYTVDPEVVKLIPEPVARRHGLMPVDRIGDTVTIAMADPLNRQAIEEIERLHHCTVQVFVTTMSDVLDAITRHYRRAA